MARRIWVERKEDRKEFFDEPLGSESAIYKWWSEPGTALGLPLLASIYDHGFYHGICWEGSELEQVLAELAILEVHWSKAGLSPDIAEDLAERAGFMREAVKIAQEVGGVVGITGATGSSPPRTRSPPGKPGLAWNGG